MNMHSFLSRIFHSPIPRLAAVTLLALAWSSLASCSRNHEAAREGDLEKAKDRAGNARLTEPAKAEATPPAPAPEASATASKKAISVPKPVPASASASSPTAPLTANGVSGKTYVNSDGDTIEFHGQGKATERNGARGVMYPYQSAVFGDNGFASSECTYSQNGGKIDLTCEGAREIKAVFTANKDGSLTGPPTGMYGHAAFANLIEKKKK